MRGSLYVLITIVVVLQGCTSKSDYTIGSGYDYRTVVTKKWADTNRQYNPEQVTYWASFYCITTDRLVKAKMEGPLWGQLRVRDTIPLVVIDHFTTEDAFNKAQLQTIDSKQDEKTTTRPSHTPVGSLRPTNHSTTDTTKR